MIRKARENDTKAILKLAKSLSIDTLKDGTKGFLVYILPESGYHSRISFSKYFYVSENNSIIDGFLMCYDNQTLKLMKKESALTHEDNIITAVEQMPEPYIFGDQIGISRIAQEQKKPIGIQLMRELFNDMKKHNINTMYVTILHKPKLNIKSKKFCTKIGFKYLYEINNKDNTVWGLYQYNF